MRLASSQLGLLSRGMFVPNQGHSFQTPPQIDAESAAAQEGGVAEGWNSFPFWSNLKSRSKKTWDSTSHSLRLSGGAFLPYHVEKAVYASSLIILQ